VKRILYGLGLLLVVIHSSLALSFQITDIEQSLNQQIPINPENAFHKIENLLADPKLSLVLNAKLMVMQSEIAYFIDQPEHILKYANLALATGQLTERWYTRALISQARAYFQLGQYNAYFASANMAVAKAELANLSTFKVSALVERAFASNFLGKNDRANKDLKLAVKYLELLPNDFDKAIILERFSAVMTEMEHIETAKTHQQQANKIYNDINSIHFLSSGNYNLGRIHQKVGDWQEASRLMLASYHWALKDNNKLNQAFSLSRLSELQNNLGNYQVAKNYLDDAILAADASNSGRVKIHVRKNMVNILYQNKAYQECKTLLVETIAFAKSYKMQLEQVELMTMLAETHYQLGAFKDAYSTLKEASEI